MIVGIDEVGRGAWAGPLVVGAVVLGGMTIDGLTDSKQLTKKRRLLLDQEIRQKALAVGLGWVSAKHIDTIGLGSALKLASRRALAHIRHDYQEIIIDGTIKLIDDPRVTLMKKADLLVPSVSAASIIAKVARDNYMKHLDHIFPSYKFGAHVGYGTAVHRQAIAAYGVTPLHRLSFAPLHSYRSPEIDLALPPPLAGSIPKQRRTSSRHIGDAAENEASNYLERQGHDILSRNWRTKFCEIDIISRCNDTVYFTEVKYRKTDIQGGGLAAITPKKHRQMTFAAELFATKHGLGDMNLKLVAVDMTGQPPTIVQLVELG